MIAQEHHFLLISDHHHNHRDHHQIDWWSLNKHPAHHRSEGGACDLDIWWAGAASSYCPTQLTFYHICLSSSWTLISSLSRASLQNKYEKRLDFPFLLAVTISDAGFLFVLLTMSMVMSTRLFINLATKERNSLEWMTRRGCLGVRTKVTPGLCLSLRSHIRHIRSARTLPLSRTVLSTICTFPSYTLRSSLSRTVLSTVNYHHNRYICNVRTDPAFTVGTSAHPSS